MPVEPPVDSFVVDVVIRVVVQNAPLGVDAGGRVVEAVGQLDPDLRGPSGSSYLVSLTGGSGSNQRLRIRWSAGR